MSINHTGRLIGFILQTCSKRSGSASVLDRHGSTVYVVRILLTTENCVSSDISPFLVAYAGDPAQILRVYWISCACLVECVT